MNDECQTIAARIDAAYRAGKSNGGFMMYETAVIKIRKMAAGRHSAVSFETSNYVHEERPVSRVKLYVGSSAGKDDGFWTEAYSDFAGAFAEVEKRLVDEMPGPMDEAPAGDAL